MVKASLNEVTHLFGKGKAQKKRDTYHAPLALYLL